MTDVAGPSGVAGVAEVVARARAAQLVWARVPVRARAGALLRLHDVALADRESLAALVAAAAAKTRRDAAAEVVAALTGTRYYGVLGPRLLRPRASVVTGVAAPLLTVGVRRRVPAGVVANIAAWNYPLVFLLGDTVAALVAGNGVVLRPDLRSVAVADAVVSLAARAGLPDGLVGVLHGGDAAAAQALVDAADHVLFTGSTRVGRLVAERAGRMLTGATLELGGKNAAYVAADADLDRAAAALALECFVGAGQTCTSTERVYVAAPVYEAFSARFAARVAALRVGADPDAEVGSLISGDQLARVAHHVGDAVARGARVLAGGRARPDIGPAVFEPTVLADVPAAADVAREETFGPVVSLYPVAGDEQAVARMNDADGGLTAAVWTRDLARGRALARRVRAGTVLVNGSYPTAWVSPALPLGGMGASGLGRRFGWEGLHEVTRSHVTLVHHGAVVDRVLGLSTGRLVPLLYRALWLMRRLRRP